MLNERRQSLEARSAQEMQKNDVPLQGHDQKARSYDRQVPQDREALPQGN